MESEHGTDVPTSGTPANAGDQLPTRSHDDQAVTDRRALEAPKLLNSTRMCRIEKLEPHPLNAQIYGDHCPDDLVKSVAENGILAPLLITPEHVVISGHRRLEAAKNAGADEVPVIMRGVASEDALRLLLLEANTGRHKTNEHRIREYREFKRLEESLATGRRGARNDLRSDSSGSPSGRARDLAAARVGQFGATTLELGVKIVTILETKAGSENMQTVEEVRTLLNEKSIAAAQSRLTSLGWMTENRRKSRNEGVANRAVMLGQNSGTRKAAPDPCSQPVIGESESQSSADDLDEADTGHHLKESIIKRFETLYRESLGENPTPAHVEFVRQAVREFASSVSEEIQQKGAQ